MARGDLATVVDHLRELPPSGSDAYRALAREAARLADNRDSALDRLLADVLPADVLPTELGDEPPEPVEDEG